MTTRIINGDCREVMPTLAAESFDCCVTSPARKANGQFEKGSHWREPRPHWERSWLDEHYTSKAMSAADIAKIAGCKENNILFWLKKHGIPRRDISAALAVKHWGVSGENNPMHGKCGDLNPNYASGSSPERQRLYARGKGRAFIRSVYARDGFKCIRCGTGKTSKRALHAHHIKPWASNPELRFDLGNAVTLCRSCHEWVHSRENVNREYLA